MDLENFQAIITTTCRVDLAKWLVLGFSGGPDSSALLHLLKDLRAKVVVTHFDHSLRPESAQEAPKAGEVAQTYGFPFVSERGDVTAHAQDCSMSIEEAARELRYRFLFRVAKEKNAQAVAVAHNADDQVETVLMHLLRGSGSQGLRGMPFWLLPNPWSKTIPLVRPLLGNWREEIEEYCLANSLSAVQDPSNFETTFFRNRLRHELLPKLEHFSPGFKRRLHQTADLVGSEVELIQPLANEAWKLCLSRRGADFLQFDRTLFLEQPLALRRILMQRAARDLHPELRDLNYGAVVSALQIVELNSSAPQDWTSGLYILTEGDSFWIADWAADLPLDWPQAPAQDVHLEAPSRFDLRGGWRISLDEVPIPRVSSNPDPFQAWVDQDRLGEELILRRRHPGDRFQPLGLESGSQKLADFMINAKLPKRARESWPLLCKGAEVVWVPGYRLAHPFRLRLDSKRALHLSLVRFRGKEK